MMIEICKRKNWCVDCDESSCNRCGDIRADCPKLNCDENNNSDCEHCDFIQELYKTTH